MDQRTELQSSHGVPSHICCLPDTSCADTQVANILTKALFPHQFHHLQSKMSLEPGGISAYVGKALLLEEW
ncbi:hypothetical protein F2Q69_00003245 [Brassica cretica]|uniref:Uncharacterized protein n=1 Tax=Brassica cretica TaxID=69181 RepID=A0A8S9PQA8_BRACR|nr:hypothetical protein F2Q69_00003245 [Brassica cretica]